MGFTSNFSDISKVLFTDDSDMENSYTEEMGENEVNKMLYNVREYNFYENG